MKIAKALERLSRDENCGVEVPGAATAQTPKAWSWISSAGGE